MGFYVLRRLAQIPPVLLVSTFLVFVVLRALPGAPSQADAPITRAGAPIVQQQQSIPQQYVTWLGNALQGDFGRTQRGSVAAQVASRIWPTLALSVGALAVMVATSFLLGSLAAINRGGRIDQAIGIYYTVVLAIPGFVFILLSLVLFAVHLRILPPGGYVNLFDDPLMGLKHLILPSIILSLDGSAELGRIVRHSLLEVIDADYIRTGRAKGLQERWLIWRHALPNALVPILTVLGISFGRILGGSVIAESIFTWPGIGRLLLEAIPARNLLMIQAVTLVYVTWFAVIVLFTDLLYAVVDPRIRLNRGARAA
jgi:peptide/nickel transport system permease protein